MNVESEFFKPSIEGATSRHDAFGDMRVRGLAPVAASLSKWSRSGAGLPAIQEHLSIAYDNFEKSAIGVRILVRDLVEQFRAQRKQGSGALAVMSETESGPKESSTFRKVPIVLRGSLDDERLVLDWFHVVFQGNSKQPQYVQIPREPDGDVDLARFMKGGAPAEIELITRVERHARPIRAFWKNHLQARRALERLQQQLK